MTRTPTSPPTDRIRRIQAPMRGLFVVFSALTALAVGALFVLADRTDRVFAWTIQPPLTAAFLGAGYAAGFVLVVLSLRDPVWAHSRIPVLTIFAFVVLTLAATLLHLDRMHFMAGFADRPVLAVAAAWFWLAVYVALPVLMLAALHRQERAPGRDPVGRHPIPAVLRAALAAESAVLLTVGTALYAAPSTAATLWSWPLTPLTARVIASWLLAFGLATALAAMAGDLRRLRTAAIAYAVFGLVVGVAVLRFAGTVDWGNPAAWVLVAVTLAVTATGVAGWRLAPVPRRVPR